MKKILLLCFVVLSNTFIKPQQITNYECLLKDKGINSFTKVSAPSIYLERTALSKPQTATFSVTFTGTGWTTQKQDAFNYAVDIWEYLINSSQQIKINAERKALGANSGILAGTRPLSYYKDFTNAPMADVNYPVALAEALSGTQLNGSDYEIKIEVNSDLDSIYYYGTDGNTPSGKTDFVSTILHEIGHGLGISHSMKVENNIGSWGQNYDTTIYKGYAQAYDKFTVVGPYSSLQNRLTNTTVYANPSSTLGDVITGGNIHFDGINAKLMNGNSLPKLYAPNPFQGGSSIAHFDEDAFPAGNSNSLFSPTLGRAESIHSPGEVGLAVLQDLGWTINRIITISSPEPGLAYMPGQSKTITWTDNIGGTIAIDLMKKSITGTYDYVSTIASHTSPKGVINSVNWTIPNNEGTFKIQMINGSEGYGVSYPFIISNQAQVATPVFNPPGGYYTTAQSVTISCSTPGDVDIYYTLDRSEPDQTKSLYSTPIQVDENKEIRAKAYKDGFPESKTAIAAYYIGGEIPPPTVEPVSGTYPAGMKYIVSWPAGFECWQTERIDGTVPPDPESISGGTVLINNPWIYPLSYAGYIHKMKFQLYKDGKWGPVIYVEYDIKPALRIAQVDDEVDSSFGFWSKWENNMWIKHPDETTLRPSATDFFLLADQEYKDQTTRKYNVWQTDLNENFYVNHGQIPVGPNTGSVLAHFKEAYNATIKNNIDGFSLNSGHFYLKDPWLIDDNSDPKGPRNRGINPEWSWIDFKTTPNITTSSINKGVLLNQNPNHLQDVPTYKLWAGDQEMDIPGVGNRMCYLQGWSAVSGANLADYGEESWPVFTSGDVIVQAKYKGQGLSDNINAYTNSSQRKFVNNAGFLFSIYESMGRIWCERSTDNGSTWTIVNDGKPLDDGEGKSPSIDIFDPYNIGVVFQENYGGDSKIKLVILGSLDGQITSTSTVDLISADYSSNDLTPVISYASYQGAKIMILWRIDNYYPSGGLYYRYATLGANNSVSYYNSSTYISGTDGSSINPSIAVDKNNTSNPPVFHIAWEDNLSSSQSKIFYNTLISNSGNNISFGTEVEVSSGSGYAKNYKPSLIEINNGVRITWMAWNVNEGEKYKAAMMKDPGYYVYWSFDEGSYVSSANINRTSDGNYIIGWTANSGMNNKYVTNSSFTNIKNFGIAGKDLQISNGSNFNSMYGMVLNTVSSPYFFNQSASVGSIGKQNAFDEIYSGRGVALKKNNAEIYFSLNDVTVNDKPISFTETEDTLKITNINKLNEYLLTEPFMLDDNSVFSYGLKYGVTDSVSAKNIFGNNSSINFRIDIVDEQSHEKISTLEEVKFTSANFAKNENITSRVTAKGTGGKKVRLRYTVEDKTGASYSLINRVSSGSMIPKTNTKEIIYNGTAVITDYELSQNFPNPFNPATTINYQLPQDGFVTLKIYDVLGNEVTTLVNEYKNMGSYNINYNASSLSSGVYLYSIRVNDFSATKKLVLMK